MTTEIYNESKVLIGREEDGVITPTEDGDQLKRWLESGVPGPVPTMKGDTIRETMGVVEPDHPLFGLALLEHFENVGITVKEKGEKHQQGHHNQMTHGRSHGGVGKVAGVDISKWTANNAQQKKAVKTIAELEAAAEAGNWAYIQEFTDIKVKNPNTYHKKIALAANNLLKKKDGLLEATGKMSGDKLITDVTDWKQTGPKLGTQPGGKFQGPDGKEYYMKFPNESGAAVNEVMANRLYEAAGGTVPKGHLVMKDGKMGIATEWQEGSTANFSKAGDKNAAAEDFAIHAWTANWDCVGAGPEKPMANLKMVDGKASAVDVGGALEYKGSGTKKVGGMSSKATEWDTLRDKSINPTAGKVFGDMSKEQLLKSAKKLEMVSDSAIDKIVDKYSMSGPEGAALKSKLKARRDDILTRAKKLKGGEKEKETQTVITKPDGKTAVSKPVPAHIPPPNVGKGKSKALISIMGKAEKMHQLAQEGKWDEIEKIKTNPNAFLSSAKKLHQYKQDLLAVKGQAAVMSPQKPSKSTVKKKIDPNEFPESPKFLSSNQAHVQANQKAVNEAVKHAKKGDLFTLKHMQLTPSDKVKEFHQQLMENVASQLNPPPPPKPVSGKLAEISSKAKAVVGKPHDIPIVSKYLVLAQMDHVPTDVKVKSVGNANNAKAWNAGHTSWKKLPPMERSAVKAYTGGKHKGMNEELRGFKPLSQVTLNAAAGLHKAAIPVPVGTTVTRKHTMTPSAMEKFAKMEGSVIQDRGIISSYAPGGHWSGNATLKLTAGPGVRALPVERFTNVGGEYEYILPVNTRYVVTGVKVSKYGAIDIEATILPFEDSQCCPP